MCHDPITRRDLLRRGVGAAAGLIALPTAISALEPLSGLRAAHASPSDLEVALKAAEWIRRSRIETRNGVTWPADPLQPASVRYDLYNGMPGVILFHLELFHATGDKSWLADARLGANELISQLPAINASKNAGLYTGLGGAVFVLEETHRATQVFSECPGSTEPWNQYVLETMRSNLVPGRGHGSDDGGKLHCKAARGEEGRMLIGCC